MKGLVDHCLSTLSAKTSEGLVIGNFHDDDENDFQIIGRISLPEDAASFVDFMNRSCRSSLSEPHKIYESVAGRVPMLPEIDEFPATTYCLQSLLASAYPRDFSQERPRFRTNSCGIKLLCMDMKDELCGEDLSQLAFGGLGVLLVRACQPIFGAADDEETLEKARDHWLVLFES